MFFLRKKRRRGPASLLRGRVYTSAMIAYMFCKKILEEEEDILTGEYLEEVPQTAGD